MHSKMFLSHLGPPLYIISKFAREFVYLKLVKEMIQNILAVIAVCLFLTYVKFCSLVKIFCFIVVGLSGDDQYWILFSQLTNDIHH